MREFSSAVCSERKAGCQRSPAPSSSSIRAIAAGLSSGQPEAAVGAEGLLRGEVVGVGLRRRRPAGRRRPRWRRSGPGRRRRRRGARPSTITPVEVSLWAQAITSAAGSAVGAGRVAGLGLDHDRVGEERRAGGRLGELLRELAVGEVQGALAHEPGGGGVPEGGRAAVAERDLVAVGQREELGRARRARARPGRGPAPGGARCPSGPSCSASARQRLRAHLRGPAAEAAVGRLQLGGDLRGVGCRGRHRARQVIDRRGWTPPGSGLGSRRCTGSPVQPRGGAMYPISYEADFNPDAEPLDDLLPADPGDPVVHRRHLLGTPLHLHPPLRLGRGDHPRPLPAVALQLQLRRRPLLGSAPRPGSTCRPTSGRRSASATTPATRSGSTSRPGRAPEPAEGLLPHHPRPAGAARPLLRDRLRPRCSPASSPG